MAAYELDGLAVVLDHRAEKVGPVHAFEPITYPYCLPFALVKFEQPFLEHDGSIGLEHLLAHHPVVQAVGVYLGLAEGLPQLLPHGQVDPHLLPDLLAVPAPDALGED